MRSTLCFSRSSLLRGELIITRRTLDGASKWALRAFLREEWRAVERVSASMVDGESETHTGIDFRHGGGGLTLSLTVD